MLIAASLPPPHPLANNPPRPHVPLCSDEEAFRQTVECITGPITKIIYTKGMLVGVALLLLFPLLIRHIVFN